jgi:hypothetical protein
MSADVDNKGGNDTLSSANGAEWQSNSSPCPKEQPYDESKSLCVKVRHPCVVLLQEDFEAAIKTVKQRTVQELAGWKEADEEGHAAAMHAAADATGNLTAEGSSASVVGSCSQQQQQGHPATPGSPGHLPKDHAFMTPRTSFSCDPRTKGRGRFQGGSVCKDTKTLFGGASADDVAATPVSSTQERSSRSRSDGGAPGSCGSRGGHTPHDAAAVASPAATGTPTPSRTAAEGVEARILAKIASVCTPGPSAAAARKSMALAAVAESKHGWQD